MGAAFMKILVLPGDGIGPEIMEATVRALEALDDRFGLGLDFERRDVGFAALKSAGSTFPPDLIDATRAADATILGPVDTAAYPGPEAGGVNPSAAMRGRLQLYANIRPSRVRAGTPALVDAMDLVVVRENTEGFYADRNMFMGSGEFMPTADVALAVRKITRPACERVARAAFELAMKRRRKVTIVHKSNVLKLSDGMFEETCYAVAKDYPEVATDDEHVDAMASLLVRQPARFDVLVATNMFGDILSNEAAELAGGLGLAGSLNMGDGVAVAQASHGSAPDIAGQDRANPTALLLSTGQVLTWLGEQRQTNVLGEAAQCLERSLDSLLADKATRTADLGGPLGTRAFGDTLAARIRSGD